MLLKKAHLKIAVVSWYDNMFEVLVFNNSGYFLLFVSPHPTSPSELACSMLGASGKGWDS